MATYHERRELHRQAVLAEEPGKHNFLTQAFFTRHVHEASLSEYCQTVKNHHNNADFTLIKLIRFLYFPVNENASGDENEGASECESARNGIKFHQDRVVRILSDFSFWPRRPSLNTTGTAENSDPDPVTKTCFWSENHIFMYLSSAHLFAQKYPEHCDSSAVNYQNQLLSVYLSAHNTFNGVYEVNSCVYLPYTMSSLLNLYDFSENTQIKNGALKLLKLIIRNLLLVCNRNGIGNLTASARQYPRNRVRNFEHNINQVIRLLTGISPDVVKSTAVTCFFLTSTFSPDDFFDDAGAGEAWISDTWRTHGCQQISVNHVTSRTNELYAAELTRANDCYCDFPLCETDIVPFYWSAGLITHPLFVALSKIFIETFSLHNAPGVRLLDYVHHTVASSVMSSFSSYASGQNYTAVTLNIYRTPLRDIVMTSFDRYNINLRAYQQNPWMLNFDGAPLWSQSGCGSRRVVPSFNGYCPSVTQVDNILVVVHATPSSREGFFSQSLLGLHDNSSFVLWPSCYFDDEWRVEPKLCKGKTLSFTTLRVLEGESSGLKESDAGCWWIARRGSNFLGLYCSHSTEEDDEDNSKTVSSLQMRELPSSYQNLKTYDLNAKDESGRNIDLTVKDFVPHRRVCKSSNHVWVICVGDTVDYATAELFIEHCTRNVNVNEVLHEQDSVYEVNVTAASIHSSKKLTASESHSVSIEVKK